MSEQQQPGPGGPPQAINLQQMARQFMAGLQRHFDMLAFNLASREAATEEAYKRRAQEPRIMPAAGAHQNFEQMQAYARDLMVRQVAGDCLNLCVNCLNNAHLFLAAIRARKEHPDEAEAGRRAAQGWQQSFLAAPLEQKFERLEKDYGVMCELEDTVVSLGWILQALVRQGGVVRAAQLDGSGALTIELKTVELDAAGGAGGQPKARIVDLVKRFDEGEAVAFSDRELQLLLVTTASFADALFKAVAEYARSPEK
jgi:hypothetical protein